MEWPWILSGVSCLIALAALGTARRLSRRLSQLSEQYWELEVRARGAEGEGQGHCSDRRGAPRVATGDAANVRAADEYQEEVMPSLRSSQLDEFPLSKGN